MVVMKKHGILAGAFVALCGLFSSCADPYYGAGYGSGAYPRNAAEAAVPIVVGAALVGAVLSHNKSDSRCRGGYYSGDYGYGGGYCAPRYHGW